MCWDKRYQKWHAQIGVNWKSIHLGYFDNFDEAFSNVLENHKKRENRKNVQQFNEDMDIRTTDLIV